MKLLLIVVAIFCYAGAAGADEYVRGHWKDTNRDGVKDTYVDGYHRSSPNNTRSDNYSTEGNYNPYTGKEGTASPTPTYPGSTYQPRNPDYRNPYSPNR